MFILHIDSGLEMRGGQWQALYLMRGLIAQGHRVRLLSPPQSQLFQAAQAQQIEALPMRLTQLPRALGGVQIIHAHDAHAHSFAAFLTKPLVVARRVAFPIKRGPASRWKYRRARHYLAVSEHVRQKLIQANVPEARISIVYDGVPSPPPCKPEARTRVVALDSEDPGKGKKIVEQAAALADIPVHFSDNLLRDLPQAAVFVYITDLEGLGSAALLAMANGAPVVASRVGGLPEIVEDGVTGLLTSNDPQDIARTIQHLLSDRPLADRLASQARARVERKFSVDHMVNETLRVYERVLS